MEGSTARWETYGDAMRDTVRRHDALLTDAIRGHGGYVFKRMGDAYYAAFHTTAQAVAAAHDAQRALSSEDWSATDGLRVRMAVHVGAVESRDGDYFGRALNKIARLLSAAHGGQVVVTGAVVELVSESLPPGASLHPLGLHRLKDLELPDHIFQLYGRGLPETFPPLRTLGSRPNNLPIQLTSFIGRDRELEEMRPLLAEAHLLTLVGPGGVGKTRLAQQLAAESLDRYADGVWLVELSPIVNAEAVADETATALSLRVDAKEPLTKSLVRELRDKQSLLIFDSCEHVIGAVASLGAAILRACQQVRILATSREPTQIPGERIHHVSVLDETSAVRLFVARAQEASNQFALTDDNAHIVREICARLDGIAFAIELAATKLAMLSPAQLLQKLNERFRLLSGGGRTALPRQQTLRALIDWSYDLLDERESLVFRRLSVFAGSLSLEAAGAVCADDALDDWEVFEVLSALVSKSLVVVEADGEQRRYRFLDSMRDYARERLADPSARRALVARLGTFYEKLLQRAAETNVDDAGWRATVGPEVDNLRAILDESFGPGGDSNAGLRILRHLKSAPLVVTPQESARWFALGAAAITGSEYPALRAQVLNLYAYAQWYAGAPTQELLATVERAVAAAKEAGDREVVVDATTRWASALSDAGRFEAADAKYREASEASAGCSPATLAALERRWGINDLQRNDLVDARRRFMRVVELERPGSEGHGSALLNLGEVEFAHGDLDAALSSARQARHIYEQLKAPWLALVASNLGAYALAAGRLDEAADALREALALLEKSGARWLISVLEHHALLAALRDDTTRAARLLGFCQADYLAKGKERESTEQRGFERLTALLNSRYRTDELDPLLATGAALSEGEALAEASAVTKPVA
jgi:predicted ATPase